MRLIDADALQVKHGVNCGSNYGGLRAIVFKRDIDKAQTIDAVPVVRCKECRHFKTMNLFGNVEFCDRTGKEIERWLMVGAEDFCSKGERRY